MRPRLGKIDIQGPDAAELLNRIYVNNFDKLASREVSLRRDARPMTARSLTTGRPPGWPKLAIS